MVKNSNNTIPSLYPKIKQQDKEQWKTEQDLPVIEQSPSSKATQQNIDQVIRYAGGAPNRRPSWVGGTKEILEHYGEDYYKILYQSVQSDRNFWQKGGKRTNWYDTERYQDEALRERSAIHHQKQNEEIHNERANYHKNEHDLAINQWDSGPLCCFCKMEITKEDLSPKSKEQAQKGEGVDIHHGPYIPPTREVDMENNMIGSWSDRRKAATPFLKDVLIPQFLDAKPNATRSELYENYVRPFFRMLSHKPGLYLSHKQCHRSKTEEGEKRVAIPTRLEPENTGDARGR